MIYLSIICWLTLMLLVKNNKQQEAIIFSIIYVWVLLEYHLNRIIDILEIKL